MLSCGQCGAHNLDDAEFCRNCGKHLTQIETRTEETPSSPPLSPQNHQLPPDESLDTLTSGSIPSVTNQPQYYYPVVVIKTNGKAIASMILGIIGLFFFCFLFWIACSTIALILGYIARREITASGGLQTGDNMALAGIICGWAGLAIGILWVTFLAIYAAATAVL
mgnify:CR=1 FL=1